MSESIDNVLANLLRQDQVNPATLGSGKGWQAFLHGGRELLKIRNFDAFLVRLNLTVDFWQVNGDIFAGLDRFRIGKTHRNVYRLNSGNIEASFLGDLFADWWESKRVGVEWAKVLEG